MNTRTIIANAIAAIARIIGRAPLAAGCDAGRIYRLVPDASMPDYLLHGRVWLKHLPVCVQCGPMPVFARNPAFTRFMAFKADITGRRRRSC